MKLRTRFSSERPTRNVPLTRVPRAVSRRRPVRGRSSATDPPGGEDDRADTPAAVERLEPTPERAHAEWAPQRQLRRELAGRVRIHDPGGRDDAHGVELGTCERA